MWPGRALRPARDCEALDEQRTTVTLAARAQFERQHPSTMDRGPITHPKWTRQSVHVFRAKRNLLRAADYCPFAAVVLAASAPPNL
jgi:hypothetical protein